MRGVDCRTPALHTLARGGVDLSPQAAIWTIAGYSSARDFWNPWMVAGISLLLLLIAAHEVAQMKAARSAARRRLCQLLDAAAVRSSPSTPAKGGAVAARGRGAQRS